MAETLETRLLRIEHAANEYDCLITNAVLLTDESVGHRVQLSLDEFITLLRHCRPRVVYLFADKFDSRDSLLAYLEIDEDDDPEFAESPRVMALVKHHAHRNGELASCLASFMFDGILHTVFEQTVWLDEFEMRADELEILLADERRQKNERDLKRYVQTTREHAKMLCENPKFTDGRPSREKRTYLARSLFPDLSSQEIHALVDEATNMDWLSGN
jgi:hypothetical protein